ncbi:MAG: hypothetical protein LBE38_05050 [Deltaproteobacteria bacterium]|nr:hypothetical protein [Deltaproteobacteria bacterium]
MGKLNEGYTISEKFREQALTPKKRGRKVESGSLLNPTQEEKIKFMISKSFPADFKLDFSTWSRRAVVELE